MGTETETISLISEHVAFITGSVSASAASRDNRRIPSVCKALGCRVSSERNRVTLFFHGPHAKQLLNDVNQCGQMAAVFSHPPSHRTLQIKGIDAKTEALQPGDLELVADACEAFAQIIASLHYRYELGKAYQSYDPATLVALSFAPTAVFEQSPGPDAGSQLRQAT